MKMFLNCIHLGNAIEVVDTAFRHRVVIDDLPSRGMIQPECAIIIAYTTHNLSVPRNLASYYKRIFGMLYYQFDRAGCALKIHHYLTMACEYLSHSSKHSHLVSKRHINYYYPCVIRELDVMHDFLRWNQK